MPFNGSGVFTRVYNWVNDKNASINITASRMDGEDDGFATGLSNCITRDGQGVPTATIPWGSQNLTGVGTLGATTGNITTLNSTTGTIATLGSTTSNITTGNITTLNTTTGTITTLNSTTGNIAAVVANTVKFPAVQVPSGDANTLDDYEEGTWTPTYGGTSGDPTVTYTQQLGSYVKIGKFVFIEGRLDTSAASGGVQFLTINGLPFACAVGTTLGGFSSLKSSGWTTAAPLAGYIELTTQIGLTYDVSVTQRSEVLVSHLTNGAVTLFFNAWYIAAA